jgi:hypothetical protein
MTVIVSKPKGLHVKRRELARTTAELGRSNGSRDQPGPEFGP